MDLFGFGKFFTRGNNGGGSGSGCGLTANMLIFGGADRNNPVAASSSQWATKSGGGATEQLTINVDPSSLEKDVSALFPIIFDRLGCNGAINFTLDVDRPGLFRTTEPGTTSFGDTYTLPANKSIATVNVQYENYPLPGQYQLTVNAYCGTCYAQDLIIINIDGSNPYGYGSGGGKPFGDGYLDEDQVTQNAAKK